MTTKRWIEREFKSRNVEEEGYESNLPIMFPVFDGRAWVCHLPADGDVTSAMASTKEEAFRKWEALTHYYESQCD